MQETVLKQVLSGVLEGGKLMANRNTLHKSKLKDLESWLVKDSWEIEETKGIWEVLRATKGKRTFLVYTKLNIKEHYTIPDNCMEVFAAYLKDKKNNNEEIKTNTKIIYCPCCTSKMDKVDSTEYLCENCGVVFDIVKYPIKEWKEANSILVKDSMEEE